MTESHPGIPQKAIYDDCPDCHHRAERTPLGLYCPNCAWKGSKPTGPLDTQTDEQRLERLGAERVRTGQIPINMRTGCPEITSISCPRCGLALPQSGNCETCGCSWQWTLDSKDLKIRGPLKNSAGEEPVYNKCGNDTCFGCTGDRPNLCDKLLPKKVVHSTGAARSSEADGYRYDLIPQRGLKRVAATCDEGAKKYSPHNWKKGFAWSEMMKHATKHIAMWLLGDKSEDHLAHACWNLLALMDYEEIHPELNDIPERQDDSSQSTGSSSSISS